jgi:plasmid maintenance system antidote protein VapI
MDATLTKKKEPKSKPTSKASKLLRAEISRRGFGGLTAVADMLDIPAYRLSRMLSGSRSVSLTEAYLIHAKFGIEVWDWLIDG